MKDDRLRIPVDDAYLTALGRAVYIFAGLEWAAVYVCDQIKPGYVAAIGKKTARQISDDLIKYVRRIKGDTLQEECTRLAEQFEQLVTRRNELLHATSMTIATGEQQMGRQVHPWTLAAIDNLADDFAACNIGLSDMVHNRLPAALTA